MTFCLLLSAYYLLFFMLRQLPPAEFARTLVQDPPFQDLRSRSEINYSS
jgi:hypothetical protein